jgi:hypothetical protein
MTWNYLHVNKTNTGIHQYDENNCETLSGSPSWTLTINDKVIINQTDADISIGANSPCTNDFKIYTTILIKVGLAVDRDENVSYTNKDKPFVDAGCCGAEVQLNNISGI